ncbi:hypothetical protein AOCH_000888 [Aspergillus ochraceoroseus]|uniref:NAD-dependent epimerase/dehydratase domain-containing protein n=1 Tax=Aspergillus ochraceoroseus TaxID=138278 RepID=A0A0F8UTB4_9EURO|nr:hypothetical protein AOCH_000888 [Aspergillus ochraceoroseus]
MSLVLITGATGFIGSWVCHHALEAGYRVRLVVRHAQATDKLERVFSPHLDQIDFVAVIHVASPVPAQGVHDFIAPAVQGTLSVLKAALHFPSIKTVAITGSVLSVIPFGAANSVTSVKETTEIDLSGMPADLTDLKPQQLYHASKLCAYKATIDFYHEHTPHFAIGVVLPSFVFGRSLYQETPEQLNGTNQLLYASLLKNTPFFTQYLGVHVADVAEAHIRVLRSPARGLQSYLLSAPKRSWVDVDEFVRGTYPDLPVTLDPVALPCPTLDVSKAENELGIVFKPMEVQVADVVDQQLELGKNA